MTKFNIRQTRELLTGQSGLALVGSLLNQSNYKYELDNLPMPANRGQTLTNSDIAVSMIGRGNQLVQRGETPDSVALCERVPVARRRRVNADDLGLNAIDPMKRIHMKRR